MPGMKKSGMMGRKSRSRYTMGLLKGIVRTSESMPDMDRGVVTRVGKGSRNQMEVGRIVRPSRKPRII